MNLSPMSLVADLPPALQRLLADFDAGSPAALARAVSIVENHGPDSTRCSRTLHPRIGRARRIGITGRRGRARARSPCSWSRPIARAGSRSASSRWIPRRPSRAGRCSATGSAWRRSRSILACSSARWPRAGRSAAWRGHARRGDVLDAFGFDRILIETVGVGQSELDIARTADTSGWCWCRESATPSRRSRPG
jgi:LAO/AO transport system kinase